MSLGAGLLSAAVDFGTAWYTSEQNKKMERETRRWNEKMWNKQNIYNHPSMQMARLQEAGLNPRLVYGSNAGGATGTSGSPVAPGRAPRVNYSAGDPIGKYLTAQQTSAMTGLNNSLQKKADSETAINFAKLGGVEADSYVKMQTTAAQIQQIRENANIAAQDFVTKALEYDTLSKTQQATIDNAYQELDNNIARKGLILSNINVNEKQLDKMTTDIELTKIMADNYEAKTGTEMIIQDIKNELLTQEKYWSSVLPLGPGDSGTILFAEMLDDIGQQLGASGVPYAPQLVKILNFMSQWWAKKKKTTIEKSTYKKDASGIKTSQTTTTKNY
jgi:hypothetical protein